MIDTYDEAARKAGVTLVPSSGFDSIPSDLGVDTGLDGQARVRSLRPADTSSLRLRVDARRLLVARRGLEGG